MARLHGHEAGNGGYGQGSAYRTVLPSPTRSISGAGRVSASQEPRPVELFDEVFGLCLDHLHSPKGVPDWGVLRARYRPLVISKAGSLEETSATINRMLSELKASHTHLYTRLDWEYYDLLDIFKNAFGQRIHQLFPDGKVAYPSIGIFTRRLRGKTFVKAVLDGCPASPCARGRKVL